MLSALGEPLLAGAHALLQQHAFVCLFMRAVTVTIALDEARPPAIIWQSRSTTAPTDPCLVAVVGDDAWPEGLRTAVDELRRVLERAGYALGRQFWGHQFTLALQPQERAIRVIESKLVIAEAREVARWDDAPETD